MAATPFVVAAAFVAVASLGAQTPHPGGATGPASKIEERSRAMRNDITVGKQVQSHVRVAVRLKNGNRLKGVVKDGRLVERVDGLHFVDAQAQEPGAGIRLWYSGGARNYVFVPFEGLAEYQVLQRLTPEQLEQIENEMQLAEVKRQEKLRAAGAQQTEAQSAPGESGDVPATAGQEPAPPVPGDKPVKYETPQRRAANKAKAEAEAKAAEDKEGKSAAAAQQATHKMWFALLQEYPPSAGWSEAKRDEIARRKVVVGANPSPSEQRFVEKFADWKKACAHFGSAADGKPAEAGADAKTDGKTDGKTETGTESKPETSDDPEAERKARRGKK